MRTVMVTEIKLSKRGIHAGQFVTIVDDVDADLDKQSWTILFNSKTKQYAKGSGGSDMLHRVILSRKLGRELEKGEFVDHINGDGLDNRRENLRLANRYQNAQNKGIARVKKTSIYKGVSRSSKNRWSANITHMGQTVYIGTFPTEIEAYEAYCRKADELHGEYANHGTPPRVVDSSVVETYLRVQETREPIVPREPSKATLLKIQREKAREAAAIRKAEIFAAVIAVKEAERVARLLEIEQRNLVTLQKITEFRELVSHRNPAIAKAARNQLHKLLIEARRNGVNVDAQEMEGAA